MRALGPADDVRAWEDALVAELSADSASYTQFADYFRTRCNELRVVRGLLPHLFGRRQHESALEIGCGFGFQSALLSPYCQSLLGIDIPVEYDGYVPPGKGTSVAMARQLVGEELGLDHVAFQHAWPDSIDVPDGAFDFVYSAYVLEHVPDVDSLTDELARVVRPGGIVLHIVPSVLDGLHELVRANTNNSWRRLVADRVKRRRPGHRLSPHGVVLPPPHSEFAGDFLEQLHLYRLERTLFPAVERGFAVEAVTQSRSWNHVVVLRRLD